MAHRYFTSNIQGNTAFITGPDAAHLARVLRAKPGEVLTLCNGAGTDYTAQIEHIVPEEIQLALLSAAPSAAEPAIEALVCLGYAKGERMEWAIQKAVELGAAKILPFFSANTVVKPKNEEEKNRRYNRIAQEAAKQSGRGILPPVEMPVSYAQMLACAAKAQLALFFYEGGGAALPAVLQGQKSIALITGAEGGFTPAEAEAACRAGCVQAGLGPRILRCETAPMAALAAVMALTGNLE